MESAVMDPETEVEVIEEDGADDENFNPLEGFEGEEITSPVKAIREKCKECSCYATSEIRHCVIKKCSLFPFRMGKSPYRSHNISDEQRESLIARGKKMAEVRAQKIAARKAEEIANNPPKKLRV